MVHNKKLKKLLRDPKLFFKDMYAKRSMQVKKHLPIKYQGSNNYTIVSAVYNVAPYLDDYFNSIIKQSLDFKKHIHIILVDDGSKDASAEIIKNWQKKYPDNIHYFYKENGGQASARNLGLEYVKTDWVVFTDPDDYLHPDYFKSVDIQLSQNPATVMLATNLKFFIENQNIVKDTHPLKFRFDKTQSVPVSKLDKFINLSAASSFFKTAHIQQKNLRFDDKVKPNFEDGKFIADYLIDLQNSEVVFDKEAVYFYRKRESGTSTLDTSWQKAEKFSNVFEYGFLPMLQGYKSRLGHVPASIQKTALYDMAWYVQYLLNRPERTEFLHEEQKQHFHNLINQVFSYIDTKNIMEFGLAGVWLFHKVGMLGHFKRSEPPFQIAYIENIDREKKQFLISYFDYFDFPYSVRAGSQELIPAYAKNVVNTLNGELFVYEKRLWIPYEGVSEHSSLSVLLNNKPMRISVKGKTFTQGIKLEELLNLFKPSEKYHSDGSWLLMDRETKADDNAEHFYRYMMQHHPEQTCYFVLNKDASDWARLEEEGFKLVEFGTKDYETHLRQADKIISSHLEKHINNYFGDLYEYSKKFVFLQHGVTKDNLSAWTNTKKTLDCFVTTTKPETISIASDFNTYKLTEKEVALTGFPRYDALLLKNQPESKKILIMPTWRSNIVGQNIGAGSNTRTLNAAFMETEYARHWHSFLHSEQLLELADTYGYEIIFAPHPNIEPYLEVLDVPSYMAIWSGLRETESIQNLFGRSAVLITDYSSVAFDMAYLNKAIIYYQFDQESFFSGTHTYQKGYFSYENDGFGPVTLTQEDTLAELAVILQHGKAKAEYLARIQATFPFQEGGNSERVYQAVKALDQAPVYDNIPMLRKLIDHAEQHQAWSLMAERIENLLTNHTLSEEEATFYHQRRLQALFEGWQYSKLQHSLQNASLTERLYWQAKMDLLIGNARSGAAFFADHPTASTTELSIALLASAFHQDKSSFAKLYAHLDAIQSKQHQPILEIAQKLMEQSYFVALAIIQVYVNTQAKQDKRHLKLELLAAYICIRLGNYEVAHKQLVAYEKHTAKDPACRVAIARLAKQRHDPEKLYTQMNRAFTDDLSLIPEDLAVSYLSTLNKHGNDETESYLLAQFRQKYAEHVPLLIYEAEKYRANQNWQALADLLADRYVNHAEATYLYTIALCRLKNTEAANRVFRGMKQHNTFEYWKLAAEVAELNHDRDLLKTCLENQLSSI